MRQTRSIMGMPVRLEIVGTDVPQQAFDSVFDYLMAVDERFSTYKEQSEISNINRGELREAEYSTEMKEVFRLAEETRQLTYGYFNIHTPQGTIDPSGLVKGWAINNAAKLLKDAGHHNFYLEIAGDIQTSGMNAEGEEWRIGIRNPFAKEEIVKVLYPRGNGVATSGTYERGSHIYTPTGIAPTDFVSVTVIAPNVYEADRIATAVFAMGKEGMAFIHTLPNFEAYVIDAQGTALYTTGVDSYTV